MKILKNIIIKMVLVVAGLMVSLQTTNASEKGGQLSISDTKWHYNYGENKCKLSEKEIRAGVVRLIGQGKNDDIFISNYIERTFGNWAEVAYWDEEQKDYTFLSFASSKGMCELFNDIVIKKLEPKNDAYYKKLNK